MFVSLTCFPLNPDVIHHRLESIIMAVDYRRELKLFNIKPYKSKAIFYTKECPRIPQFNVQYRILTWNLGSFMDSASSQLFFWLS